MKEKEEFTCLEDLSAAHRTALLLLPPSSPLLVSSFLFFLFFVFFLNVVDLYIQLFKYKFILVHFTGKLYV